MAHDLTNGSDDDDDGLDGLAAVVDYIAYRFWKCGKFLTMAHDTKDCTRRIRCRFCFYSSHKEKSCFAKLAKKIATVGTKKGNPGS